MEHQSLTALIDDMPNPSKRMMKTIRSETAPGSLPIPDFIKAHLDIARKAAIDDTIAQATAEKKFNSTGGVLKFHSGLFHPENDFSVAFAAGYLAAKGYGVLGYGAQELAYKDMTGRGGKAKMLVMEVGKYG